MCCSAIEARKVITRHFCSNVSRRDAVDSDAVLCELDRHWWAHRQHRALGTTVGAGHLPSNCSESCDRSNDNDRALGRSVGDHCFGRQLSCEEHAFHIDGVQLVERGLIRLCERDVAVRPRARNANV